MNRSKYKDYMNKNQVIRKISVQRWNLFSVFMSNPLRSVTLKDNDILYLNDDVELFCKMHKIKNQ